MCCLLSGGEDGPTCTSIASSASGQYLAAATNYLGANLPTPNDPRSVYVSNDYGATWTAALTNNAGEWASVAMDASGKNMLVGTNAYEYYTSSNYGVSWTFHDSDYSAEFFSVAMSAQSSVAASSAKNGLYVSNNAGVDWSLSFPPKSANQYLSCSDTVYVKIASTFDGSALLAALCGNLYIGAAVAGGSGGSGTGEPRVLRCSLLSSNIYVAINIHAHRSFDQFSIAVSGFVSLQNFCFLLLFSINSCPVCGSDRWRCDRRACRCGTDSRRCLVPAGAYVNKGTTGCGRRCSRSHCCGGPACGLGTRDRCHIIDTRTSYTSVDGV